MTLSLASLALASQVLVVDAANGPGTDFLAIQPAIDAALPGDLIRVRTGTYAPFVVDGKGVSVVGDTTGGPVDVLGDDDERVAVRNVPVGQTALLQQLAIDTIPGTLFEDNVGHVILSDSTSRSRPDFQFTPGEFPFVSGPGLRIEDSARVWVEDCTLTGADAAVLIFAFSPQVGLSTQNAFFFLYDSTCRGGQGQNSEISPGGGGTGALCSNSTGTVRSSQLEGGPGGVSPIFPEIMGVTGLQAELNFATLTTYDTDLQSVDVSVGSSLSEMDVPRAELDLPALVASGPTYDAVLTPPASSFGFLLVSDTTASAPLPLARGATAVGFTPIFVNLGFFATADSVTVPLPAPSVPPGTAIPLVFQSVFAQLDATLDLSNPAWVHLL